MCPDWSGRTAVSRPRVLIVIPARLGSSRFKHKVLVPLAGRPLLYHVWRAAKQSSYADRVVVATDSDEIKRVAAEFGAEVMTTAKKHKTGSDRAAEVAKRLGGTVIVNFQGDTLGLGGKTVDRAIELVLKKKSVNVATLAHRITNDAELTNPNVVKVVTDSKGRALMFSRSVLPFVRDVAGKGPPGWQDFKFLHHVGVYVFSRAALERYASWPRTSLEKAESLEQLRLLERGEKIHVVTTRSKSVSIDSPEDLENWSRRRI